MSTPLVLRELTRPTVAAVDDLRVVEQRMPSLPHTVTLAEGLALTLVLPTGVARAWLHEPGDAVVSRGADQVAADAGVGSGRAGTGPLPPMPLRPRVLVVRDRRAVAAFPAVAGRRWLVPEADDQDTGPAGRPAQVCLLDWHVDVATVLGLPSAAGAVRVGWRWMDDVSSPPRLAPVRPVAWTVWLDDDAMGPEVES
ncbi:MAG: hypothetical protein KG028_01835 [Actinobacteria bacterium]|jgi:hypothetical protein|nr:hypothetical protein [Actinomycetota bacterium]